MFQPTGRVGEKNIITRKGNQQMKERGKDFCLVDTVGEQLQWGPSVGFLGFWVPFRVFVGERWTAMA